MRLGFLPLFKPDSFTKDSFTASGLEYFSANALGEIVAFVQQQLPEVQLVVKLSLAEMLRQKPEIVLLWSTSACFGLVNSVAESLKTYLDIPVWLAGPHISYLPQSLPEQTDLGILGEVELPLLQLLKLFLKDPNAGVMQYRRIPGIVYQSRGHMYSGAPAQEIPNLNQLPAPNYRLFLDLPGFTAPVIRSARVPDCLLTALAYPPSRKTRFLKAEHLCQQMEQIDANYDYLFRNYPFPKVQQRHLRPVFIPDYQLFYHPQRLEALHQAMLEHHLPEKLFLILHSPPETLNRNLMPKLKQMNVRKLIFSLGPFGHQNPLLSRCRPEQLEQALKLCQEFQIGIIGQFILNPDFNTQRKQLAQSYLFLKNWLKSFEILHVSALGPIPGTPLWDAYAQRKKPDAQALQRFPWHSLDIEKFAADLPLFHSHLDRPSLKEIHTAFTQLKGGRKDFVQPLEQEIMDQAKDQLVRDFAQTQLRKGERILELVHQPEMAIKPYLGDHFQIDQIFVRQGRIQGQPPQEKAQVLLMISSLNGLRNPAQGLKQLLTHLEPGGRIYLQMINPLFMGCIERFFNWRPEQSQAQYPILKFIKEEEAKALLESLGLEVLQTDYTIMNNIEAVRPSVENLAKRFEHFGPLRIPQHMLYISEIKLLARNRT